MRYFYSPKDSPMPEFPMKQWSVKLYILDQDGNKHPASCFQKVVYNLHPSFENPQQSKSIYNSYHQDYTYEE